LPSSANIRLKAASVTFAIGAMAMMGLLSFAQKPETSSIQLLEYFNRLKIKTRLIGWRL
jgi:hypothetical protein